MEIRSFKLASSEEIIGRLETNFLTTDAKTGPVTLSKVRLIVPMNNGGSIAPMLLPWILSDQDATVTIDRKNIVAEVTAVKEIEDIYLRHTSGLALGGR